MLIPFDKPDPSQPSSDDSELLLVQKSSGDALPFVVVLGQMFLSAEGKAFRTEIEEWVEKKLKEQAAATGVSNRINSRLFKTYALLLFFSIKVGFTGQLNQL